jgi:hypothetical protein
MTFRRGQFVRITYGGVTVDGMVLLASSNSRSLMLAFDGALGAGSDGGGLFLGMLPVLLDGDGVYRDIVQNEPVLVELLVRE